MITQPVADCERRSLYQLSPLEYLLLFLFFCGGAREFMKLLDFHEKRLPCEICKTRVAKLPVDLI